MRLYTFVVTTELQDDTEAARECRALREHIQAGAEVIEMRWYRDLDAELLVDACVDEWGRW